MSADTLDETMRLGIIILLISCQFAVAGDLDSAAEKVQESKPCKPKKPKKSRSHHHHDQDCEDEDFLSSLLGPPTFFAVSSPWWVPHAAVGDDMSVSVSFADYPYQAPVEGYLTRDAALFGQTDDWAARMSTEYATDFSGLERIGTDLLIENSSRFAFDAEFNSWIEDLPTGKEDAYSGDANLVFRFAQNEKVEFHSGIGVNWFANAGRGDAGFNFTYGATFFPVKPIVIQTELDAGNVGSAGLFHLNTSIGVILNRFEAFTGYDYTSIGGVPLQGWTAGFTIWF